MLSSTAQAACFVFAFEKTLGEPRHNVGGSSAPYDILRCRRNHVAAPQRIPGRGKKKDSLFSPPRLRVIAARQRSTMDISAW